MLDLAGWTNDVWQGFAGLKAIDQVTWISGLVALAATTISAGLFVGRHLKRRHQPPRSVAPPDVVDRAVFSAIYKQATGEGKPIGYRELNAKIESRPKSLALSEGELIECLTRLSDRVLSYAQAHGVWLPPITAIVVNDNSRVPGNGLDRWVERHYNLLDPLTKEARLMNYRLQRTREVDILQRDVYARMNEIGDIFSNLLI